jgi:hypothetical protein
MDGKGVTIRPGLHGVGSHMTDRIARGLNRLCVAVLVAIGGGAFTTILITDRYFRLANSLSTSAAPTPIASSIPPEEKDPIVKQLRAFPAKPAAVVPVAKSDWQVADLWLGIATLLALAAWGFFRGLGWVVAWFARD